jgi:hypothetical protein
MEDTHLQNIDVMTDVSVPATAFTRYTVAPSIASKASKYILTMSILESVNTDASCLSTGEALAPSGKWSEKLDLAGRELWTKKSIS